MATQVFGPGRPAAARAAITELAAAQAAYDAYGGWPTDAVRARLRAAQEVREGYWGYGDAAAALDRSGR